MTDHLKRVAMDLARLLVERRASDEAADDCLAALRPLLARILGDVLGVEDSVPTEAMTAARNFPAGTERELAFARFIVEFDDVRELIDLLDRVPVDV